MQRVLRPLLSFALLVVMAVALIQGVGRVSLGLLWRFEGAVNDVLEPRAITVQGLRGDWFRFNPQIAIDRVALPAGFVSDIRVELDLLQTLWHGRIMFAHLAAGDARLRLARTAEGRWQLAGMPPGGRFDPLPLLTETGHLQFAGSLTFDREDYPLDELALDYVATNAAGQERHRLEVRNTAPDCPVTGCLLRLEAERDRGALGLGTPLLAIQARGEQFRVPAALIGVATLAVEALAIDWHTGSDGIAAGRIALDLQGTGLRDGRHIGLSLTAAASGRDGGYAVQVEKLAMVHGAARADLAPLALGFRNQTVWLALDRLTFGPVLEVVQSAVAWNDVADRWLTALAMQGEARQVRVFFRPETGELGYGFDLDDFSMDGYRGVPRVRNGAGVVRGYSDLLGDRPLIEVLHRVSVDVAAENLEMAFPEHLDGEWLVPVVQGRMLAGLRRGELGIVAEHLAGRVRGRGLEPGATWGSESVVAGSVAISRRGEDETDRRLTALGTIDQIPLAEARRLIPVTLPPRLYAWLTQTPMDGQISNGAVAYQGQMRVPAGEPGRRLELAATVADGTMRFHPDWPAVDAFTGQVAVAGRDVHVAAAAGQMLGAAIDGSRLTLHDNAGWISIDGALKGDAAQALTLVRRSPLQRWLRFIAPDWTARGPFAARGQLSIPLRPAAAEADITAADLPPLAIALDVDLDGVDLDLPGYRLDFSALDGAVSYGYPDRLDSTDLVGELFAAPVRISASTGDQRFRIDASGTARSSDIWRVAGLPDPAIASGAALFDARLEIPIPPARQGGEMSLAGSSDAPIAQTAAATPVHVQINSGLAGMTLALPAPYGKLAEDTEPMQIDLIAAGTGTRLELVYRDARGWLEIAGTNTRGSFGLGTAPAPVARDARAIQVTGHLDRLSLDDLPAGDGGGLSAPVRVRGLTADTLVIGGFVADTARIEADLAGTGFSAQVDSKQVQGRVQRADLAPGGAEAGARGTAADVPISVELTRLWLPSGSGSGDPLSVDLIPQLPPLDVRVDQLTIGTDDYGNWQFRLRRESDDLWLHDLEGRLRGVDVIGSGGMVWRRATNETTFEGALRMQNLAEVLPLWGYAPSVETERARVRGKVTWAGSPAAFDLQRLRGQARARAYNGRFLDVATGGGTQRIMSLLNFTTIAKRMSLDFSDVVGKGISFDQLRATLGFDVGTLQFLQPLEVEGTGLKFRLSGSVRLADRALDHELIVTLPVSRSLPWYAAYVALANPIAGLGVLVGERVLRKPLEQFSSAKYRVTGTVENPEVKLVSVFDTSTSDQPKEVPVDVGDNDGEVGGDRPLESKERQVSDE